MRPSRMPLLLLALAGTGCIRTTWRPDPDQIPAYILTAQPARAWQVVEAGTPIGRVVYYASGHDPSESLYSVQNALCQELGLIDSLGKAWRFRPHLAEAEWVTTGTLLAGARAILDSQEGALREIPITDVAISGP